MFSCTPEDWSPFSDPTIDIHAVAMEMVERAKIDPNLPIIPNEYECSLPVMKNFLRECHSSAEAAYELWIQWIVWRKGMPKYSIFLILTSFSERGVNEICEESIEQEVRCALLIVKYTEPFLDIVQISILARQKQT